MSTETKNPNGYEHRVELNGVGAFVFHVKNRGKEITVSGWRLDRRKFKEGDRLLLCQDDEETRYTVIETDFPSDPPDQYFLTCKFTPRHEN